MYSGYLEFRYGKNGVPRQVNGQTFRISNRLRMRFPPVHDPEVAEFLRQHIQPGMTCLNIGANVGIMTLQMSRWSGPTGMVIAFEPNPFARASLEHHVAINDFSHRVRIEPFAVSNAVSSAPMFVDGDDGMGRLGEPNQLLNNRTQQVDIHTITLDAYCSSRGVTPNVIMMDIEGFEIEALEGARDLIRNTPGLIIVAEFHPSVWKKPKLALMSLFRDIGIEPVGLTGQSDVYTEHSAVYFQRI